MCPTLVPFHSIFLWWPGNAEVGHGVLFEILPITEVSETNPAFITGPCEKKMWSKSLDTKELRLTPLIVNSTDPHGRFCLSVYTLESSLFHFLRRLQPRKCTHLSAER